MVKYELSNVQVNLQFFLDLNFIGKFSTTYNVFTF